METRRAVSAGGVIYRRKGDIAEVAITKRAGTADVWALPKGTVEKGEKLEETAAREVAEETGLTSLVEEKIDVIDYWFVLQGVRYHKFVHFYLLRFVSGDTNVHDWEVDEVAWLPIDKALARLTFKSEKVVLEKAAAIIGKKE